VTTSRQAQELCPRDRGRTVAGYDAEGTYFSGVLIGGDYGRCNLLTLYVGRQQYQVRPDTQLEITGART